MKNFAKQKNQMHKSFFLQISQITNQNKFLLKDMNNVSSKNKIQKYLNELKQNPVPFNPKMFITHNQKSNNVKEINTNSNQVYLPSITKSAISKKTIIK